MGFIQNVKYDIKAIRKYGFIRHIKYLFDYRHVIINLHFHLDYAPTFSENRLYRVEEVDYLDSTVLQTWSNIVNDAFNFDPPYNVHTAKEYLTNHLYKNISNLFFIYADNKPVGTFFIGTFKKNKNVGCAGRVAVLKKYQGRGLGKFIAIAAIDQMRKKGIKVYEETFNMKRDYSIRLFIKCGGVPQFRYKYLQLKPTRKNFIITLLARKRVKKMYQNFREEINKEFLKKD